MVKDIYLFIATLVHIFRMAFGTKIHLPIVTSTHT